MLFYKPFTALILKCFCILRTERTALNKENTHPSKNQQPSVAFAVVFSKKPIFYWF